MDATTIQKQVLIGSSVTFFLKTGQTFTGTLTELTRTYVVIEAGGKTATISLEMIGAWQLEEASEQSGAVIQNPRFYEKQDSMRQDIPTAPSETILHDGNRTSDKSPPDAILVEAPIKLPESAETTINGNRRPSSVSESPSPETIRSL